MLPYLNSTSCYLLFLSLFFFHNFPLTLLHLLRISHKFAPFYSTRSCLSGQNMSIKTHFPHLSLTLSLHRVLFTRRIILHALNSLVNQCWSCSRSRGRQICYSQDVAEISRLHCLNYFSSAQRVTSVHIYKHEQCSQYSHDAVR